MLIYPREAGATLGAGIGGYIGNQLEDLFGNLNCPLFSSQNSDDGESAPNPADLERNEGKIAKKLNRSVEEIKDAIHAVKRAAPDLQAGQRKNPDVMVDIKTGEVYPQIRKGKVSSGMALK